MRTAAIETCSAGDVDENLAIVDDLEASYHEMIVCGGLALDFQSSLVNVIAYKAMNRHGPQALAYQGDGIYATANGMMALRTTDARGVPLTFPALDPESYFTGRVIVDPAAIAAALRGKDPRQALADLEVELEITARGPGFDLLGIEPAALVNGRVRVTPRQLARAIGERIHVATRIDVTSTERQTTVHYLLDGPPQPVGPAHEAQRVPLTLRSITAERPASGQAIRITDWQMQFRGDGGRVLDGSIALDVTGGAFPYAVRYEYPHRPDPDVTLACR